MESNIELRYINIWMSIKPNRSCIKLVYKRYNMIIQDNLFLTRANPSGQGGFQFLYRVNDYGLTALSGPQEEISMIHWEVEIIKFTDSKTADFEICHTTELADKTLKFYTDKSLNEFIQKAFQYFEELNSLEKMLPQES